jgi:hypothetical protein
MQYGGEGTSWNSSGIDDKTHTTMLVQGKIAGREAIDVCGTMVDTYRVESTERMVNVESGYNSTTNDGKPNVYNIATQFGGLIVQQHTDTTTTLTVAGVPSTLIIDNTSTVQSVKPLALR